MFHFRSVKPNVCGTSAAGSGKSVKLVLGGALSKGIFQFAVSSSGWRRQINTHGYSQLSNLPDRILRAALRRG